MQPTTLHDSLSHVYEIRPRNDHRGVDLISDVLPFGRLWYGEPDAVKPLLGILSKSPVIVVFASLVLMALSYSAHAAELICSVGISTKIIQ